jgi:hypothetical protein
MMMYKEKQLLAFAIHLLEIPQLLWYCKTNNGYVLSSRNNVILDILYQIKNCMHITQRHILLWKATVQLIEYNSFQESKDANLTTFYKLRIFHHVSESICWTCVLEIPLQYILHFLYKY